MYVNGKHLLCNTTNITNLNDDAYGHIIIASVDRNPCNPKYDILQLHEIIDTGPNIPECLNLRQYSLILWVASQVFRNSTTAPMPSVM